MAIREASAERLHALSEAADAAKAEADSLAAAKAEAARAHSARTRKVIECKNGTALSIDAIF